jgi:hypothetical protein
MKELGSTALCDLSFTAAMTRRTTEGRVEHDPLRLDATERRFWREVWDSVPAAVAREHGVEARDFGPVQATVVGDLADVGMLNLVLGATEPGAVRAGHLDAALEWVGARGVSPYVPLTPDLPESAAAEELLQRNGFARGEAWMKFVRDPHPPRFRAPGDVEVVELGAGESEPFGMIAATGFGMPAWAATFFARLPGREGWRCYGARVDGELGGCGAMLIHEGIAELGIGATAAASSPCFAAASKTPRPQAATPSSPRPASGSRTGRPAATATSCVPASRRLTCARTGSARSRGDALALKRS